MKIFYVLVIFFSLNAFSQNTVHSFFDLSSPERWWVVTHPFKAKKAFHISKEVLKITDSVGKLNLIENDKNGGQLDAFKHSYWLARLSQKIGQNPAIKLGKAHEKGNYQTFKKHQLEDGALPDKISSEMDFFNNDVGVSIVAKNKNLTQKELINFVISDIKNGKMKIIKKDDVGNFLTCDGVIISKDSLKGKWENKKCLVASEL